MQQRPALLSTTIAWCVVALFAAPLLWMLLSSLKPIEQLREDSFTLLPWQWQWSNYPDAIRSMPYVRYLGNTLFLCVGTVLGTVISCSLAAYALAKLRWRGRELVFALVIVTMLLPWHVTMIPRFLLIKQLGLYNSLWALVLPTFCGNAFYIFLLRQFFRTVPEELSEAARLDGLSEWGIYWRILLPLSRPALIAVALFQAIATWNDFGGPLLYLSDPDKFPLAYGLERLTSAYSDQTHLLLAAATLFTLPMAMLFLLTQRFFMKGISMAGIKG